MRKVYEEDFIGMTQHAVFYDELVKVRLDLIAQLLKCLTSDERQFLFSIKQGRPEWERLPIAGIDKLPSLEWKIINIRKMDSDKHKIALQKLKALLEL